MGNADVSEEQSLRDFAFDVYNDAWDETVTGEDSHACRMEAVVEALRKRLKAEGMRRAVMLSGLGGTVADILAEADALDPTKETK